LPWGRTRSREPIISFILKHEVKIATRTEIDCRDAFHQCRELINLVSGLVTMLEGQAVPLAVASPAIIKVIARFEEIASRGEDISKAGCSNEIRS
jgi:hypothetical protein